MDWNYLLLSPQGRIGRQDFWIGFAVVMGLSVLCNLVPIIGQIAGLLLLWPQACIHSKRLHDMGRSAWLMLIPFGVAIAIGGVAAVTRGLSGLGAMTGHLGAAAASGALTLLALGCAFLVGLAFLLWVGLTPGQPGPNRFGESQLSPA